MSPNGPSIIGRIIAAVAPPPTDGFVGRAVVLPQTLQAQNKAQIIAGEVVEELGKDVLRIKTPEGNIDVRVTGRNRPAVGQQVQVEVPAGNPPRQITVTNITPEQAQQIQNQSQPSPRQQTQSSQQGTPPKNAPPQGPQTPSQPTTDVRPQTPTTPNTQASVSTETITREALSQILRQPGQVPVSIPDSKSLPPLERGNIVRLLPLTPAQTQQALQTISLPQAVETVLPRLVYTQTVAQANLSVQAVQNNLQTEIVNQLQTPQTGSQSVKPQTVNTQLQPTTLPTINQATGQNIQFITQPQAQTQIITPNAPAQNIQTSTSVIQTTLPQPNILQTSLQAAQTSLPVTPQLTISNTNGLIQALPQAQISLASSNIQPLDSRIQNFTLPSIQLVSPQTTTPTTNTQINAVISQIQAPNFQLLQGQATSIPAQVIGFTPQQLPIVMMQTPGAPLPQSFILQAPAPNLSIGSQIQISPQNSSVLTQAPTTQLQTPLQPPTLFDLLRPGPWPALEQLYQASIQVSAQAAQALSNITPNPVINVQNMGPAALFFLAAVRSGDLGSWLGSKTLDALTRGGKRNALTSLSNDLSALPRGEAPVGEWRAVPLPLFYEGEMQKMTLFTRSDTDGSDEEDENKQTRFIFDLNLSRMGPVQLDGLIKGKRLDLLVRTQTPFSEPMRQIMRQSYTQALEDTELYGDLNFQGDPKHWVNVLQKEETFGADA